MFHPSPPHAPPIVGVRLRPPEPGKLSCWDVEEQCTLRTTYTTRGVSVRHGFAEYAVDRVFDGKQAVGAQTEDVFQHLVQPLLDAACTRGTGGCCLAYGQTGSGKSYTMHGDMTFGDGSRGLVHHAIDHLLHQDPRPSRISMSVCQIHLDNVTDVLAATDTQQAAHASNPVTPMRATSGPPSHTPPSRTGPHSASQQLLSASTRQPLSLGPKSKAATPGARRQQQGSTHVITSYEEAERLLSVAHQCRAVAATKLNHLSSRSHFIVRLDIEGPRGNACVMLVDLAGSEDPRRSGASGKQFSEAVAINLSLHTLQNVVMAWATNPNGHIPLEDNALTRHLKPCLSPSARISMLITMRSELSFQAESMRALEFARMCARMKITKAVNKACGSDNARALIAELQQEILTLRLHVEALERDRTRLQSEVYQGQLEASDSQVQLRALKALLRDQDGTERVGQAGRPTAEEAEHHCVPHELPLPGPTLSLLTPVRYLDAEFDLRSAQDQLAVLQQTLTATQCELEDTRVEKQKLEAILARQQQEAADRDTPAAREDRLIRQVTILEAQMKVEQVTLQQLTAQLQDAHQTIHDQEERLATSIEDLQLSEQRLQLEQESYVQQGGMWAREKQTMEQQLRQLEGHLQESSESQEQLVAKLRAAHAAEIAAVRAECEACARDELRVMEERIEEDARGRAQESARLESMSQDLQQARDRAAAMEEQMEGLRIRVEHVQAEANTQQTELRQQLADSQSEISKLQAEIAQHVQERVAVEKRLAESEAVAASIAADNDGLRGKLVELQEEHRSVQTVNTELRTQLSAAEQAVTDTRVEATTGQQNVQEISQQLARVTAQLQQEQEARRTLVQAAQQARDDGAVEVARLQVAVRDLQYQLAQGQQAQADLAASRDQVEEQWRDVVVLAAHAQSVWLRVQTLSVAGLCPHARDDRGPVVGMQQAVSAPERQQPCGRGLSKSPRRLPSQPRGPDVTGPDQSPRSLAVPHSGRRGR